MAIGMGGRKDDEDGRRAASGVGQLAQSPGQDAFVVRANAFGDDRCASGRCGMRAEHGAGDGMRRVAAPRIGYGQRRFGYAAGGQPLAGMHAEQAGILPRKAEAAEQGLKCRDSRMVRKVVAGLAECGKRTAEAVIEGVPEARTTTRFPSRASARASSVSFRTQLPIVRVLFTWTGHNAMREREPYTASAPSNRARMAVSEGNPVPHETMSMCPAASRVLPFVIWNAPV